MTEFFCSMGAKVQIIIFVCCFIKLVKYENNIWCKSKQPTLLLSLKKGVKEIYP